MKKIKILFSIGRLSVGGAEKLLIYKLKFLDKNKFEPHLLTLFPETKDSLAEQMPLDNNHWHRGNFRGTFDIGALIRLWRLLRREQFTVVVTELFSANLIVRLAAMTLIPRPRIISYEHNLYPHKSHWQIWADRQLARWTHTIIVDAQSVRIFTAEQEAIPLKKFLVLYHPPLIFEEPAITRKELLKKFNIPDDVKIILTVSRLVEEKGHAYLINAAKDVVASDSKAYFFIVGWGPLEQKLKSEIENLKLEKHVILTGKMDIKDILPYADLYVEPASIVDVGIAMLEAMKLKKPIVATRVGEIPVFVHDNENGYLVDPSNADDLAGRILMVLSDPSLGCQFGEVSARIISRYTIEGYMQAFEELVTKSVVAKTK